MFAIDGSAVPQTAPSSKARSLMKSEYFTALKLFITAKFKMTLVAFVAHSFILYFWFILTPAYGNLNPNVRLIYHAQFGRVKPKTAEEFGVILPARGVYELAITWGAVLATAVCAMLLFMTRHWTFDQCFTIAWIENLLQKPLQWFKWFRQKISMILHHELAPKVWIPWCGGLNVRDLLVMMVALVYAVVIVSMGGHDRYKRFEGAFKAGKITKDELYAQMWKGVARSMGAVSTNLFSVALYPVPRSSFLHYAFNTEFSSLIKYHRWFSFSLIWLVILHGCLYYAIWFADGSLSWRFWSWDGHGANFFAGFLSAACGALMLVTSMSFFRRRYFQVFIRCHIIGFVGFTVFAYLHWNIRWYYQTPPLMLLTLDWMFRMTQWLHPSWVTGQSLTADKSIITLTFTWSKATNAKPGHYIFLNVPTARRWQWHPITIADVDESHPAHTLVTVHMKCYGAWSTDLMGQMIRNGKVLMRADGPYGQPYGYNWRQHTSMVIIAGGIGATPMLGMLREMAIVRKRQRDLEIDTTELLADSGFPQKVAFHWSCRGMAEFALLDNMLLEAYREDDWLSIQLYCTRSVDREGVHAEPGSEAARLAEQAEELRFHKSGAATILGKQAQRASALGFQPGVLEAYGSGWYWICCHILAFVGSFAFLLLAQVYDLNKGLEGHYVRTDWKTCSLIVVATFVGGFGLPALLVAAVKTSRWKEFRRQHDYTALQQSNEAQASRPKIMTAAHLVGSEEDPASVNVQDGRPDIYEILKAASQAGAPSEEIGVLVAGPSSLVDMVHLACCQQNRDKSGARLDFGKHAFEL